MIFLKTWILKPAIYILCNNFEDLVSESIHHLDTLCDHVLQFFTLLGRGAGAGRGGELSRSITCGGYDAVECAAYTKKSLIWIHHAHDATWHNSCTRTCPFVFTTVSSYRIASRQIKVLYWLVLSYAAQDSLTRPSALTNISSHGILFTTSKIFRW